jgi:GDP-4-dehydro-6-deoxy-D-mannose reductase
MCGVLEHYNTREVFHDLYQGLLAMQHRGQDSADIKDVISLKKALADIKPDRVFYLAAQSFVPASWRLPAETFAINAIGQINLFEALLNLKINPKIQIAGSSEEYGHVNPDEVPMKETNPLRPLSPYAVSKVA